MNRRDFVGTIALCAVAPSFACERAGASMQSDEIAVTVHKDPG